MCQFCKRLLSFVKRLDRSLVLGALFLVGISLVGLWPTDQRRSPASSIVDDNYIEQDLIVEQETKLTWLGEGSKDLSRTKREIRQWTEQREHARLHGLENRGGIDNTPSVEEIEQYVQNNYLRFFSRSSQRFAEDGARSAFENWTLNNEIDATDERDRQEGYIIKAKRKKGITSSKKYDKKKKVKVGKEEIDFTFEPRIEMGMVRVGMKTSTYSFRGWLGANGNQEVEYRQKIPYLNSRVMVRRYIEAERTLISFDQPLFSNISFRYSHDFRENQSGPAYENSVYQLRFSTSF